jgi:hypothetical protein
MRQKQNRVAFGQPNIYSPAGHVRLCISVSLATLRAEKPSLCGAISTESKNASENLTEVGQSAPRPTGA